MIRRFIRTFLDWRGNHELKDLFGIKNISRYEKKGLSWTKCWERNNV